METQAEYETQGEYLKLDQIKVGDYVDCGFIGIVGAIAKSLDGETYIQVISPKAAAYGNANNCDWLPYRIYAFLPSDAKTFYDKANLYAGVIERRNQTISKNL